MSNPLEICAMFAKACIESLPPGASFEDRAKAALGGATEMGWIVRDEEKLLAAFGAILVASSTTPEEKRKWAAELTFHRALSAASSGVPVDFTKFASSDEEMDPSVPPLLPALRAALAATHGA